MRLNDDKIIKCNHKKLRMFNELPRSIARFLPEDDDANQSFEVKRHDVRSEAPMFILSSSSESSSESASFEGFSAIKELSDSSNSETEGEQVNGEVSDGKNNEKSLIEFNCSELVSKTIACHHSTPRSNIDQNFEEFLKAQSFRDSLMIMEQNVSAQVHLISIAEEKLTTLCSLLEEASSEMNDAIVSQNDFQGSTDNVALDIIRNDEQSNDYRSEREFDPPDNFSGFFKDKFADEAANTISELKIILQSCKSNVEAGRKRREDLRRNILEYKQNRTKNSTFSSTVVHSLDEVSSVISEADDTLHNMAPMSGNAPSSTSTPHRMLRSHGRAKEYPNVHSKILEYRIRKLNKQV